MKKPTAADIQQIQRDEAPSRRPDERPAGPSIGTKLTIWTSVPVILLLSSSAFFLGKEYVETLHEQSRQHAVGYLQTLAVPVSRAMAVHALDRLDAYVDEGGYGASRDMTVLSLAALDDNCNPVARSKPGAVTLGADIAGATATPDSLPEESFRSSACSKNYPIWERHRDSSGKLVLDVSMPAVSGLRWGTVIGRFDLSRLEEQLEVITYWFIGLTILLTLTMALALRLALGRLVVEPIFELAQSADDITKGRMDRRAWVASSDEIGRLAVDFNAMADQLQVYTEKLERKVEQRSAEVKRQNKELARVNHELQSLNDALEQIAVTDALTGIYNRRRFDEALELEFKRAERRQLPFSVILADVDHFKNYNDTNGHQAGDRALQAMAEVFQMQLRATDVLARYGGEEFVALLLDTPKKGAVAVAESLRAAVHAHEFEHGGNQPGGRVTTSIGVATFPDDANEPQRLVEHADKALYLAKATGRNRVIAWGPDTSETQRKLADAARHDGRKPR